MDRVFVCEFCNDEIDGGGFCSTCRIALDNAWQKEKRRAQHLEELCKSYEEQLKALKEQRCINCKYAATCYVVAKVHEDPPKMLKDKVDVENFGCIHWERF